MSRVLVTGASGFVGRHLCDLLVAEGYNVIGTTRSAGGRGGEGKYRIVTVRDIGADVDWGPLLAGVDFVVHLAARVHVMRDDERDPLAAFRRVNVDGTNQLLRHRGMKSVKRFVYVSTVKVHGDNTANTPFSITDDPCPTEPYARSKLEAEQLVEDGADQVGFKSTIIRPPLVYGAGVGGNFIRLLDMVNKGVPLPLGRVGNSRSLVNVNNLCDLIRECLTNPVAAGQRFLVSDGRDVSTPDLIRVIASSMSRPARLMPVPVPMLRLLARLVGQSEEMSRLIDSLQVDISETIRTLDWRPPYTLTDGIDSTVAGYQEKIDDA